MHKLFSILVTTIIILFVSCKKDSFTNSPDALLIITADTIKFDTVFTTTGSVTQAFKIINPNKEKLMISSIKLMGGSTSSFQLNIDGINTNELTEIEMEGNDSLYVFASVYVDQGVSALPFIISDSISINYNGNQRYVQLEAYGQNANFIREAVIDGNEIWNSDLPYVILGGLLVDTSAVLTIESGTRIYVHADAPIIVDGSLIINGTSSDPVIFKGDRLDEYYRDIPGAWPGIFLRNSSVNNSVTFAIVKNAYQSIVIEGPSNNSSPKLILKQCIIDNAFDAGLYAINSEVNIDNTLISNCANNLRIEGGGKYFFTHNTIATYTTNYIFHSKPSVSLSDAFFYNGTMITNDLNVIFTNCIIWGDNGSLESEVETIKEGSGMFSVVLDHCLFKAETDPNNTTFNSVIRNEDPLFDSIDNYNNYYDFRISDPFAPGIDQGISTPLMIDLEGNNRNIGLPDLGSYEKQ